MQPDFFPVFLLKNERKIKVNANCLDASCPFYVDISCSLPFII